MKFLLFKTNLFVIIFFCAVSVFAQTAEEWSSGHKTDDIEAFYRFEKSGSNSYEAEVKIVNSRNKPVEIIVKIEQKEVGANLPVETTRKRPVNLIRSNDGTYIKLTVKSKGTLVSEKIEIDGSEIKGVKIACWSNVSSQNKCDLESYLPKERTTENSNVLKPKRTVPRGAILGDGATGLYYRNYDNSLESGVAYKYPSSEAVYIYDGQLLRPVTSPQSYFNFYGCSGSMRVIDCAPVYEMPPQVTSQMLQGAPL